ncbi:MAG: HAMP domain-containing histidine kinase, partial [Chloroflexi bacterium]|nr:HAMP domain-containing histidine kinase [Chloroflexota bacterium]
MNHQPDSPPPNPASWRVHFSRRSHWREHYLSQHRPPWWPENEEWPPRDRRQWRKFGRHNPFFRRLGCLFLLFNLITFTIFAGVLGYVLNAFGIIRFSFSQVQWFRPFTIILAIFVLVMIVRVALNLRRMSMPLDDLLDASNRVASGDFSARVEERPGPPEIRSLIVGFNSMAERLQINDEQRRAMLADVSHELRTPLTIIQGNVEGILDGMYPANEARLKSVIEETQILSRLVDDLRTLSMAESGALQLKREPTDLPALIRETVAAFELQADEGGVRIETSLAMNELSLEIDPERIRQVLTNLLANALRYTPRGEGIKVSLVDAAESAERRAVVSVEDRGPGIAPADLPHVFDRFYKSADSRGMGLGLSIAKYIVEAHGGEI